MDKRDRVSSRRELRPCREGEQGWERTRSVLVTRISSQGIPQWTERLVREKCPKSQRRGILCDVFPRGREKLPDTPAWLL